MSKYSIDSSTLIGIADAIRGKTGGSSPILPTEMASQISVIETGVDTSDATATENHILNGATAYVNGRKVTGVIPENGTISLTINALQQQSVTIPSGHTLGGSVTLTDDLDNETDAQAALLDQAMEALTGKTSGGSGSSVEILTASVTPSSNARSISFTNLKGQPIMFSVMPAANTSLSSSTRYAVCVVYDGDATRGVYSTNSTATHTTNGFTWTYSNGTLTINTASTSNGGYFRSGIAYWLVYAA